MSDAGEPGAAASRLGRAADDRLRDGSAWRELCAALERSVARLERGETPRDRAEGTRHLLRFLASGIASCVTHDDPDHPVFGRMIDYARPWGLERGVPMLAALGPERVLDVRFEVLLAEPAHELRRICAFFELDAEVEGWSTRAAALIRGAPTARAPRLPPDERARLHAACVPGMRLIGRG